MSTEPETAPTHALAGIPYPPVTPPGTPGGVPTGPNPSDPTHTWQVEFFQESPCATCKNQFTDDVSAEGYFDRCRYIHGAAYTVASTTTTNQYEYLSSAKNLGKYDPRFLIEKYQKVCAYIDHLYWLLVGKVAEDARHWVYTFDEGVSASLILRSKVFIAEASFVVDAVSGRTIYLRYADYDFGADGGGLPGMRPDPSGIDPRSMTRYLADSGVGSYAEPIQVGDMLSYNLSGADLKKYIGGVCRIVEPPIFESNRVKLVVNKNVVYEAGDTVSVYGYGKTRIPIPRFQPFSAFWTSKKSVTVSADELESGYYYFKDDQGNKVPIAYPIAEWGRTNSLGQYEKEIEGTFAIVGISDTGWITPMTLDYAISRTEIYYDSTVGDYVGRIYLGDFPYAEYAITFCHRVDTFEESNFGKPTQTMCEYCRRDPTNSVATMNDNGALRENHIGYYGIKKDAQGNHWYCEKMNEAGVKPYVQYFQAGKCYQTNCPGFKLSVPTSLDPSHINMLWMGGGILTGRVPSGTTETNQPAALIVGFPSLGYMAGHTCIFQDSFDYFGGAGETSGVPTEEILANGLFAPSVWQGNGQIGFLDGDTYKFGFTILKEIAALDDVDFLGRTTAIDAPYVPEFLGYVGHGSFSQGIVPERIDPAGGLLTNDNYTVETGFNRYLIDQCHALRRLPSVTLAFSDSIVTDFSYLPAEYMNPYKGGRIGPGEKIVQKVLPYEEAVPVNLTNVVDTWETFVEIPYKIAAEGSKLVYGFSSREYEEFAYRIHMRFKAHGGDDADYSKDENFFNEDTDAFDLDVEDYHTLDPAYNKYDRGSYNTFFTDDDLTVYKVQALEGDLLWIDFYPSPVTVKGDVFSWNETEEERMNQTITGTFLANGNAVDAPLYLRCYNPFCHTGRAKDGDLWDKISPGDVVFFSFEDNMVKEKADAYKDKLDGRLGFYLSVVAAWPGSEMGESGTLMGSDESFAGVSAGTVGGLPYYASSRNYDDGVLSYAAAGGVPNGWEEPSGNSQRLLCDVVVVDGSDYDGQLFRDFLFELVPSELSYADGVSRGGGMEGRGLKVSKVMMSGVFPPSKTYSTSAEDFIDSGHTPTFRVIPDQDRALQSAFSGTDIKFSRATGELWIGDDAINEKFTGGVNCVTARGYFYTRQKTVPAELVLETEKAAKKLNAIRVGGFGEPVGIGIGSKDIVRENGDINNPIQVVDSSIEYYMRNGDLPTQSVPTTHPCNAYDEGPLVKYYGAQEGGSITKADLRPRAYYGAYAPAPIVYECLSPIGIVGSNTYFEMQYGAFPPIRVFTVSTSAAYPSTSVTLSWNGATGLAEFDGSIAAYDITNVVGQLRMDSSEISAAYIDVQILPPDTYGTEGSMEVVPAFTRVSYEKSSSYTVDGATLDFDTSSERIETVLGTTLSLIIMSADPVDTTGDGTTDYWSFGNTGRRVSGVSFTVADTEEFLYKKQTVNVTSLIQDLANLVQTDGSKYFACLLGGGVDADVLDKEADIPLLLSMVDRSTDTFTYELLNDPEPPNGETVNGFAHEYDWKYTSALTFGTPKMSNLVIEFDPDALTVPEIMPTSFDFDPLDSVE